MNPFKELDEVQAYDDRNIKVSTHNLDICSEDFDKCEEIEKYKTNLLQLNTSENPDYSDLTDGKLFLNCLQFVIITQF